ncbi:MAG: DUF2853 family protein [Ahrensia sp.]|nr:DUF2853 family protein [Ahrensia sp.]
MSKLDEKVAKYIDDHKKKIGTEPDAALMRAVTKGCGPTIYKADAEKVSAGDKEEMERIKKNFLIKKLGLADGPKLDEGLDACVEQYGRSNRSKFRAVFYYLLVKHFKKASVYS